MSRQWGPPYNSPVNIEDLSRDYPIVNFANTEKYINQDNEVAFNVGGICSENGSKVRLSGAIEAFTQCIEGVFEKEINFSGIPDGDVIIIAAHSDKFGNDTREQITLVKDTIAPISTIVVSPFLGPNDLVEEELSIAFDGDDPSDLASIEISIEANSGNCLNVSGSAFDSACPVWLRVNDSPSWNFKINKKLLSEGISYQLISRSKDHAGNLQASYGAAVFIWDQSPPIIELGSDTMTKGNLVIHPAVQENNIADILWSKKSGPGHFTVNDLKNGDYSLLFSEDGDYEITLEITDKVGFSSEDSILVRKYGTLHHFFISLNPSSPEIYEWAALNVRAKDIFDNDVDNYQGTLNISVSDSLAFLASPSITFNENSSGVLNLQDFVKFNSYGTQTITLNEATSGKSNSIDVEVVNRWRCLTSGTKYVFDSMSNINGNWNDTTAAQARNVWIFDFATNALTTLTRNTASGYDSIYPQFMPQLNKIVFNSKMSIAGGDWNTGLSNSFNVFSMNNDGTGITALTKNTNTNLSSLRAVPSRDGQKIVFQSKMDLNGSWNGTNTNSDNIWVMNNDGSGLAPLTRNTGSGYNVSVR